MLTETAEGGLGLTGDIMLNRAGVYLSLTRALMAR